MVKFSSDYDALVGSIYDCAANPELWPETLASLRDHFQGAFAEFALMDFGCKNQQAVPTRVTRDSGWDSKWLQAIPSLVNIVPGSRAIFNAEEDQPWSRLSYMSESEFLKTDFYNVWSRPQKLKDCINIRFLKKGHLSGMFTVTRSETARPFSFEECVFATRITPHIRRAILINDLTDKGRMALTLYRQVLDTLSVAVFVVGPGQRLVFTNAAGDKMLSEGEYFTRAGGALQARREAGQAAAFEAAVDRALMGDMAIGMSGIGVPLIGSDGDRVAAYVLPMAGKDVRGALGPGHCAVFVAKRGEQQPMLIEVLRTMFDLTVTEARVVMLLAKGDGPQTIAESLQISVNTVRTHLKHAYAKTDTPDQTALVALIHTVLPPVAVA